MRYILRRDRTGCWGVFDVRRQKFECEGLELEEADQTKKDLNKQSEEEIKNIVGTPGIS